MKNNKKNLCLSFSIKTNKISIKQNIRTILHYALDMEKTKYSIVSYYIMTQSQPEVFQTLCETPVFKELITIHFTSQIMPELLSRLESIVATFIITLPSQSMNYLGDLIFKFLDYTEFYSTISLFRSLFSDYHECHIVHNWLVNHHIFHEIAKRISQMDTEYKSDNIYDDYYEKYNGLFKIVHYLSLHEDFSPNIADRELILSLGCCFSKCPPAVNGSRWLAITDTVSNSSPQFVEMFLPMAITTLLNGGDKPTQDIVSALTFIAQSLHMSKATRMMVLQGQVFSLALKLALQFQESSILENTFRSFVTNALKYPEFDEKVFKSLMPLFIVSAFSDQNPGFARVSRVLLFNFTSMAEGDPELQIKLRNVEGYSNLLNNELKNYRELLLNSYGGDIMIYYYQNAV